MPSSAQVSKCWNTMKKINCKLSYIKNISDFKQESMLTKYFKGTSHKYVHNTSLFHFYNSCLFCDSPLQLTKKEKNWWQIQKARFSVRNNDFELETRLDDLQSLGGFVIILFGFFFPKQHFHDHIVRSRNAEMQSPPFIKPNNGRYTLISPQIETQAEHVCSGGTLELSQQHSAEWWIILSSSTVCFQTYSLGSNSKIPNSWRFK